jgi:hypothetical protein
MSWFHTRWVLPFAEPERYANLTASLRSLHEFDQLTEAEQRSENLARVSRLLHRAHQSSPFYRFRMDAAGVTPSAWDINSPIPLSPLTKADLRVAGDAILCRSVSNENLRVASTGGTTGTPARIWRTVDDLRQKVAMQIHLESQVGYSPGDSVLMIWGADRDLELSPSWKWKLYQQGLMHQYTAPVGMLNDQVFRRFGKLLQASSPEIIYGYSSCIARFAEYVYREKLQFKAPRRVLVTAEPLTPQDRELIQRTEGRNHGPGRLLHHPTPTHQETTAPYQRTPIHPEALRSDTDSLRRGGSSRAYPCGTAEHHGVHQRTLPARYELGVRQSAEDSPRTIGKAALHHLRGERSFPVRSCNYVPVVRVMGRRATCRLPLPSPPGGPPHIAKWAYQTIR